MKKAYKKYLIRKYELTDKDGVLQYSKEDLRRMNPFRAAISNMRDINASPNKTTAFLSLAIGEVLAAQQNGPSMLNLQADFEELFIEMKRYVKTNKNNAVSLFLVFL